MMMSDDLLGMDDDKTSVVVGSNDNNEATFEASTAVETAKLKADLESVMEKVTLCRELLVESPGIEQDELLADVIGFLEACRDRIVDVIEAGSQGLLSEDLFGYTLKVNDALLKTLEAERTGAPIAVDASSPLPSPEPVSSLLDLSPKAPGAGSSGAGLSGDMDLLSMSAPAPAPAAPAAVAVAVAVDEEFDPFGANAAMPPVPPTAAAAAAAAAAATPASDAQAASDDFDSFFESLK